MDSSSALDLSGHVAVVTGSGRGIGRAHALELGRRGAKVVVNDVVAEVADAVVAEIRAGGGEARASYASAATAEGAAELVAAAVETYGALQIVIANAGIMRNGLLEDLDPAGTQAVLDVNLHGPFALVRAAWPHLRAGGYGRVLLTSSSGGLFGMPGAANYAAAKGGIYGLTKALATEGAEHGIRVNALVPMANTTIATDDPVPGHADRYPAWVGAALRAQRTADVVTPMAIVLASPACAVTGEAYFAGFGRFARVFVGETPGWSAPDPAAATAEDVLAHFEQIRDPEGSAIPADIYEELVHIARSMGIEPPAA